MDCYPNLFYFSVDLMLNSWSIFWCRCNCYSEFVLFDMPSDCFSFLSFAVESLFVKLADGTDVV